MEVDSLLQSFTEKRILVIGDMMIDAYLKGSVTRVSPEAPVPIVNFQAKEDRLGGAANVALNLRALGAKAILCAVIGTDENSVRMTQIMDEHELSTEGIIRSENRMTTVKTRVIGNNQQLLRIDSEDSSDINQAQEDALIERIKDLLTTQTVDAIILEDYNKGVLTEKVIRKTVELANAKNIPTTVDPKKKNFFAFENVSLFKPNLKELKEGLDVQFNFEEKDKFEQAVNDLRTKLNCNKTFITLSENGVFIQEEEEKNYVAAHKRNITDVSGAGDTVISVATLCLASGCTNKQIAEIANLAGGLVCEHIGVVSIDKERLRQELTKLY
ncbi:bifunctional ADP-heptose synthase [Lishizhenia sp.]|uniref:bifunctional heptose 7-phosphate kinase/heptose 1-phosphate adenyltransferase n=1 Tax=Lishizhenia sp. TaxID=2497594 RepID=UPI00299E003F|nr:bifunctional ADP-heptose synthase [Lishizhenia sp.]MDX1445830.1 bifunctional ADP-heptose synthase [Lishizhenia sp.]